MLTLFDIKVQNDNQNKDEKYNENIKNHNRVFPDLEKF